MNRFLRLTPPPVLSDLWYEEEGQKTNMARWCEKGCLALWPLHHMYWFSYHRTSRWLGPGGSGCLLSISLISKNQAVCVCVCVKWMFFNLLFLLYWPSQALGISTCHSCTESLFALFFKLFVLVCVFVCVSQSICRWHEGVQAGLMTANSWTWLTGFQNQKISGGGG